MLMIRMARFGAKKKPSYRVVVIDKERARRQPLGGSGGPVQSRQPAAGGEVEPRTDRVLDEEWRAAVRHGQPVIEEEPRARSRTGRRLKLFNAAGAAPN